MGDAKGKIVIADDCKDLRDLLRMGLEKAGYEVDTVSDGMMLITYLKDNQDVDIVILDIVMPERSGLSVLNTVRSIVPATRLIIYTAHHNYKNSVYAREADAFVDKTEGLDKILEAVKSVI